MVALIIIFIAVSLDSFDRHKSAPNRTKPHKLRFSLLSCTLFTTFQQFSFGFMITKRKVQPIYQTDTSENTTYCFVQLMGAQFHMEYRFQYVAVHVQCCIWK